jgi:hypothetical protein
MEIDLKPPKGMKTVMCDNKPIGYVKDVPDQEEAAKLAKKLLQEKGLWRDISKPEMIYRQAQSFANTAAHVYEKDLKSLPRDPQGICPFVVNAAFSAEMYLKCLQQIHGEVTEAHVLTALFKPLPNKVKDKINKICKKLESEYEIEKGILFKEHLKNINNAFVNWRYIYEKHTESVNIQQVIFVLQVLHETAAIELGIKT